MESKKEVNEWILKKQQEIANALSDPVKRKIMYADE